MKQSYTLCANDTVRCVHIFHGHIITNFMSVQQTCRWILVHLDFEVTYREGSLYLFLSLIVKLCQYDFVGHLLRSIDSFKVLYLAGLILLIQMGEVNWFQMFIVCSVLKRFFMTFLALRL